MITLNLQGRKYLRIPGYFLRRQRGKTTACFRGKKPETLEAWNDRRARFVRFCNKAGRSRAFDGFSSLSDDPIRYRRQRNIEALFRLPQWKNKSVLNWCDGRHNEDQDNPGFENIIRLIEERADLCSP